MSPISAIGLFHNITSQDKNTTKLLVQYPLITWAKFNYHRHQSQFHCSILLKVGQILWHTFQMCPKIMTPHQFECKKVTEENMIPEQKWSHMTCNILDKIFIWPQNVTCVTFTHNWPLTNFLTIWLVTALSHKITHTVSRNHLVQI